VNRYSRPVILAVDDDPSSIGHISAELERRYDRDYQVVYKADSRGRRNTSSARGCDGNKQASSGGACKARADAFTWSTAGLAA
jgi:hypothetical protein